MDNFLCWVSNHLGFQIAVTGGTVHNRGWVHCPFHVPLRCSPHHVLAQGNEGEGFLSHMHGLSSVLQGLWGRFRSPGTGTTSKALPTHKAHKRVLPPFPWARAFSGSQDLFYQHPWSSRGYSDQGALTKRVSKTPPCHVWTVTQDTQWGSVRLWIQCYLRYYISTLATYLYLP